MHDRYLINRSTEYFKFIYPLKQVLDVLNKNWIKHAKTPNTNIYSLLTLLSVPKYRSSSQSNIHCHF